MDGHPPVGVRGRKDRPADGAQARRRPTLDEVALRAGVSRSAASRVINNTRDVSRSARQAVAQGGARARVRAQPTAGRWPPPGRSRPAGRLARRPGLFADPFFAHIIVGVNAALEKTDLVLMLLLADSTAGRERLEKVLRSRRADGIMLLALHGEDPLYRLAQSLDLPVVLGGRPLHGEPPGTSTLTTAAAPGVATEHLIASGRRRIAAITGPQDTRSGWPGTGATARPWRWPGWTPPA